MAGDTQRSRSRSARRARLIAMLAAASLAAAFAPNALAGGAIVTRGEFQPFAAGIGLPITGHAIMIRTADGRTIVSVVLDGLIAGATYGSHVHKQACADGEADGHYRFDPAGAVVPPNEIWPGPFTANEAGVALGNTITNGTAGPAAVSVVVHAPVTGAKIACADLA